MRKFFKVLFVASATILLAGYLVPERKEMPCCTPSDYNHNTIWYWPTSTMALLRLSLISGVHSVVPALVTRHKGSIGDLCSGLILLIICQQNSNMITF